ncbi:MAG: cohesin domain-containing protein [Anaerolineae bacterium]
MNRQCSFRVPPENRPLQLAIFLITLFILLIASQGAAQPAAADGPIQVNVSPTTTNLTLGQIGTVDIRFDNLPQLPADGVYGGDVRLTFDPALVQVVNASGNPSRSTILGPLLTVDPGCDPSCYFTVFNNVITRTGEISVVVTKLNPGAPVYDPGVYTSIRFKAITVGTSPIHFTFSKISTRDGVQIPSTNIDGQIVVDTTTAVHLSSMTVHYEPAEEDTLASQLSFLLGAFAAVIPGGFLLWLLARRQ